MSSSVEGVTNMLIGDVVNAKWRLGKGGTSHEVCRVLYGTVLGTCERHNEYGHRCIGSGTIRSKRCSRLMLTREAGWMIVLVYIARSSYHSRCIYGV